MLTWVIFNVPLGATWYTAAAGTVNAKDKTHTIIAIRWNIKSSAYSCFNYLLGLAYLEKDSLRPYANSHTN